MIGRRNSRGRLCGRGAKCRSSARRHTKFIHIPHVSKRPAMWSYVAGLSMDKLPAGCIDFESERLGAIVARGPNPTSLASRGELAR